MKCRNRPNDVSAVRTTIPSPDRVKKKEELRWGPRSMIATCASGIPKQTPWKEPRNGSMAVGVLILSPDKRRGLYTGYLGHSCRCGARVLVGDGWRQGGDNCWTS